MTWLTEYGDRVTITDTMGDEVRFSVTDHSIVVRAFDVDEDSPGVLMEPADFLALLRVAVEYVDGMAAGVADVLAAHHAAALTVEAPVTATPPAPTGDTARLYALPSGEVAAVQRMGMGEGWLAAWWPSRNDYDLDRAEEAAKGNEWSDRCTASMVVDSEADAVAELGAGAQLLAEVPSL